LFSKQVTTSDKGLPRTEGSERGWDWSRANGGYKRPAGVGRSAVPLLLPGSTPNLSGSCILDMYIIGGGSSWHHCPLKLWMGCGWSRCVRRD
jgi:hypothetical protein